MNRSPTTSTTNQRVTVAQPTQMDGSSRKERTEMHTNRTKLTAGLGSLAAITLLLLAVPTDSAQALRRPPMPCVAVRVGVYPVGAGFCPTTAGAIDWHKIARRLQAAGGGAALSNTAHKTAIPT